MATEWLSVEEGKKGIEVVRILKHLQTVDHPLLLLEPYAVSDQYNDYFKLIMNDSISQSSILWDLNDIQPEDQNKKHALYFFMYICWSVG